MFECMNVQLSRMDQISLRMPIVRPQNFGADNENILNQLRLVICVSHEMFDHQRLELSEVASVKSGMNKENCMP